MGIWIYIYCNLTIKNWYFYKKEKRRKNLLKYNLIIIKTIQIYIYIKNIIDKSYKNMLSYN